MTDDIDDNVARLAAAHPALFEGDGRMPAWSDLAAGWYELVDRLCTDIERALKPELARQFVALQIKEKFGTLRFYWRLGGASGDLHVDVFSTGDPVVVESSVNKAKPSRARSAHRINQAREQVRELVDAACDASCTVCMRCGARGALCRTRAGWLLTLCDQHRREVEQRDADDLDA